MERTLLEVPISRKVNASIVLISPKSEGLEDLEIIRKTYKRSIEFIELLAKWAAEDLLETREPTN